MTVGSLCVISPQLTFHNDYVTFIACSSRTLSVKAGWRVVPGAACGSGHGGLECTQAVR